MGHKYVARQEADMWGNEQTVIRRGVSAYDVGSAIGIGAGLLIAARRNSQLKEAVANVEAAQKHLTNGDYERVLGPANSLIGTKDKEAQTFGHFYKASALHGLERYDEAIKEYSTALDLARAVNQVAAAAYAFVARGMCHFELNDLGAAMRDFTSYIQLEPDEDLGYYWQGFALRKLGDLDQALANFSRAVSLNPGDAANYRERASVHAQRDEIQQAINDLSHAITLRPEDSVCYTRRADLYAKRNDLERALADYNRAVELAPNDLDNYRGRAAVYYKIGDTVRGAADAARVSQEEPVQKAYQEYFYAAKTAYNSGIKAIYTEADTRTKPAWGRAIAQSIVSIMVCLLVLVFLSAIAGPRDSSVGLLACSIYGLIIVLPYAFLAGARGYAKQKVKDSTAYLKTKSQNEARLPGFEEFFRQYLEARKDSRLQELQVRTRAFFEKGPASSVVRAYSARCIPMQP